jgi:uncharacterized protein YkwD
VRNILGILVVAGVLAAPAQASPVQDVRTMKALVNATRTQHGLRPVRFVRLLDRSALLKAEAIRSCGSFTHTPCGASVTRSFQQVGYRGTVGENLAWGTGGLGTPSAIVSAWLTSPRHRAILLGRQWREAGVAAIGVPRLSGYSHVRLWVLHFGSR